MHNGTHGTPIFSIFSGAIGGVYAFFQNYGLQITDMVEFFKVVSFGFIGGMCGYAGKYAALSMHRYFKNKAEEICK